MHIVLPKTPERTPTRNKFSEIGAILQEDCRMNLAQLNPQAEITALYLHIPFCEHKCHYCDFYSIAHPSQRGPERKEQFTEALIKQLHFIAENLVVRPKTLFVGGGTPTGLAIDCWRKILDAMRQIGLQKHLDEFTVEANPDSAQQPLIDHLAAGGVNRISIGAQSFNPDLLKTLERWHQPANVSQAVRNARQAGIDNINLDLIFAIPGQTIAMLQSDLDSLLQLNVPHLSCYNLTYEPGTPMTHKLHVGQIGRIDPDLERQMYQLLIERLDQAGYEHYEISNWAKRDDGAPSNHESPRRCAHNMIYWRNGNWLGLGPSAASHVDGVRWKVQPHLDRYIDQSPKPPVLDIERLDHDRHIGEQLMLALRLREGVRLAWFIKHVAADDPRHKTIAHLIELEWLERTATHLRLTHAGLFVADSIIAELL
jgi:oxygen-independent coproporphyrinogen-3 oxidase